MSLKTLVILASYDLADERVRQWLKTRTPAPAGPSAIPSTDYLQWDYDKCGSYQNSEWGD